MSSKSKTKKPPRAQRAPNLDDERVSKIVELLDGWSGALTWSLLVEAIEEKVGGRYARQALDRHVPIKDAYQQAKQRMGGEKQPSGQLTEKEIRRRAGEYDRLTNEVARLEREGNNYAQQFARWVWNLRQMKISEDQLSRLDADLPARL